jgi:hypothetical protein
MEEIEDDYNIGIALGIFYIIALILGLICAILHFFVGGVIINIGLITLACLCIVIMVYLLFLSIS